MLPRKSAMFLPIMLLLTRFDILCSRSRLAAIPALTTGRFRIAEVPQKVTKHHIWKTSTGRYLFSCKRENVEMFGEYITERQELKTQDGML